MSDYTPWGYPWYHRLPMRDEDDEHKVQMKEREFEEYYRDDQAAWLGEWRRMGDIHLAMARSKMEERNIHVQAIFSRYTLKCMQIHMFPRSKPLIT